MTVLVQYIPYTSSFLFPEFAIHREREYYRFIQIRRHRMIGELLNRGIVIELKKPVEQVGERYEEYVTRVHVSKFRDVVFNESVDDGAGGGLKKVDWRKALEDVRKGKIKKVRLSSF